MLPVRDQVQRESYRAGDRIVAFVVDIDKAARGPQIILSRTHKGLLEKLFEMEVPEIYEKIVRIEASAREPGARSKIAVSSRDRDVDPVGACVGMKGSRVQAVVQELRGEKIDIVPYDPDPVRFVCNAIAPAEVSRVLIDAATHTMELIVPDDKLSLAIGKKGQNVRLASQLTGWRIDIHSETKVREMEARARHRWRHRGRVARAGRVAVPEGWRSAAEVSCAKPDELAAFSGVGSAEAVRRSLGGGSGGRDRARSPRRGGRAAARRAAEAGAAATGAAARGGFPEAIAPGRHDRSHRNDMPSGRETSHREPVSAAARARQPASWCVWLAVARHSSARARPRRGERRGAWVHPTRGLRGGGRLSPGVPCARLQKRRNVVEDRRAVLVSASGS